ncbi:P-loop containing nucleoside triphosphate hydrolase protein [Rhizoclosmatium globosum]|uniref:RNA helicase n=1 Tax=Rhizoclosmatium globosum TaxID=329046 RepID=A0A1Y2D482_9FUNG|nr:P-loop containing nucleoside triphosphate hydrolase protein [Rhizoclosmatium globosum]|eukprot:ORY53926.1 P-loop containing nucleoside triphosphate hydrolase protein [Rhizoclosmatium globosum]
MLRGRQNLPSYKFRDQIIDAVEKNQVVIICGETGCGKSTQTGQFLLEHLVSTGRGGRCNMICTQPRRISAISLAERVAAERAEAVGESIGYSIRGENVRSPSTRLIFATTGILLRMLQGDPSLAKVTHVIVDEVHERSVDSDFLLVILRDLVAKRPDFRLVLMSATIDSETFSGYFGGAPVLQIPGFTHPVTDLYLEDVLRLTKYVPETRRARIVQKSDSSNTKEEIEALRTSYESMSLEPKAVTWLLKESAFDAVDYNLVAATVKYIHETNQGDDGAVLVFLQEAVDGVECLPLHAQLSSKEQGLVFRRVKKGLRKVVVATNVAETSITIDDCVFVIDAGRVKGVNAIRKLDLCLVDTLASRASCKQRRGRAGRVRPGTCYKLFTRNLEQTQMASHAVPEILRVPLEQLCLSLKAMGVDDVRCSLGKQFQPQASKTSMHMASLPVDLRIGKMLVYGAIFGCLGSVLTVAAILSNKSPFMAPSDRRDEAKERRKTFMWDKSDLLTDCRAYDGWVEASGKGKRAEAEFCETNFLSMATFTAISDSRKQYLDTLVDIGFVNGEEAKLTLSGGGKYNLYSKDSRIVKAAIAAGLYPQIVSIKHPDITYVETAHGAVEREPLPHELEFMTENDGRVSLHPSSVLAEIGKFEDLSWYSKVFVRDGTMISPWPVLMFGGDLEVDHEARTVGVEGVAVLVGGLRRLLDRVLEKKIREPGLDVLRQMWGQCWCVCFVKSR